MLDVVRRLFSRRQQVLADAQPLIDAMPALESWRTARERGIDLDRPERERTHWWRVAKEIERRLEIRRESGGFVPPI